MGGADSIIGSGYFAGAELLAQGLETGLFAQEEGASGALVFLQAGFESAGAEGETLALLTAGLRQAHLSGSKDHQQKLGLALAQAIREQPDKLNRLLARLPQVRRVGIEPLFVPLPGVAAQKEEAPRVYAGGGVASASVGKKKMPAISAAAQDKANRSSSPFVLTPALQTAVQWLQKKEVILPPFAGMSYEEVERVLFVALQQIAQPIFVLQERPGGGGFLQAEGQFERTPYFDLQIDDPAGSFSRPGSVKYLFYQTMREVLAGIRRATDLFKAYVVVKEDHIVINMDPGSHKEFLAIYFPPKEGGRILLAYQHLYSGHERGDLKETHRHTYIKQVLNRLGAGWNSDERGIFTLKLASPQDFQKDFADLLRLAASVKDLDIALKEKDIDLAGRLFEGGATNLLNFLTLRGADVERHPLDNQLNPHEQKMLAHYREYLTDLEAEKARYREIVLHLRKAKELNYEIIALLLELQKKGGEILTESLPIMGRQYPLRRRFDEAIAKLKEMESEAKRVNLAFALRSTRGVLDALAEKFIPAVEAVEAFAKSGEGMSATALARNFEWIFGDSGNELNQLQEAQTLQEAVRFLHGVLYQSWGFKDAVRSSGHWSNNPYADVIDPVSGIPLLDVTHSGLENSLPCLLFRQTVGEFSKHTASKIIQGYMKMESPSLIFGDDYALISLPAGRHRIEIEAQVREKPDEEYGISFCYYEPGFEGGGLRLRFIVEILRELGFHFDRMPEERNRGLLMAHLGGEKKRYTEDREGWAQKFSEVVRLVYALPDLDLSDAVTEGPRLFREGVTDIKMGFYCERLQDPVHALSKVQENVRGIFRRYWSGKGERCYAVRMLLKRAENKIEELQKTLELLDADSLDLVIEAFYDLALEAEAKRDFKLKSQYLRMAGRLEKFFEAKFP